MDGESLFPVWEKTCFSIVLAFAASLAFIALLIDERYALAAVVMRGLLFGAFIILFTAWMQLRLSEWIVRCIVTGTDRIALFIAAISAT